MSNGHCVTPLASIPVPAVRSVCYCNLGTLLTGLIDDLRYAVRGLISNRSFAVIATLSLALAIGANTTVFSFLNAIFLRPLPVREPSELVSVFTLDPRIPGYFLCSFPNYRDYRENNRSFSSLLVYSSIGGSLTGGDRAEPILFQVVSSGYFRTLGIDPIRGRTFLPEEDSDSAIHPVAVISYSLWMNRFGGDPQILEKTVELQGRPFRVIGVSPPGFQGLNLLNPAEIWVPLATYAQMYPNALPVTQRRPLLFSVVGRLGPGVTMQRAAAEMLALSESLERQYPRENEGRRAALLPLAQGAINPRMRSLMTTTGTVFLVITGLVLLIACANVSNLLLARAAARSKEFAIRLALGAGRGRLIRQLLTESILLAAIGGAAGLLFASWLRNALWSLRPPQLSGAVFRIDLDGRVLAFTIALTLITGVLFGLAPSFRSARADLATDLKERTGQAPAGTASRRTRSVLVTLETALCVIALVGAGLFVRSLRNAERVDTGFDSEHLAMIYFNAATLGYDAGRTRDLQRRVLERAASTPGVSSVALSKDPMFRVSFTRTILTDDGAQANQGRTTLASAVSPGYFRTTGIPLLRGRDFNAQDTQNTPRVAIVNEVAAARYWPRGEAIGRRFRFFGDNTPIEVVGIARTANYIAVGEVPQALVYTSLFQDEGPACALIFRAAQNLEGTLADAERQVQALEPHLLLQSSTVRTSILSSLWAPRLTAGLLTVFGLFGLLLASVGVYGVISYSIHQRVREIGIRMALGASAASVQMLVLGEVLKLITLGISGGLLIAMAASQTIRSLLFVTGPDVVTFILAPALLVLVAITASWIPVMRATRIDAAQALRHE